MKSISVSQDLSSGTSSVSEATGIHGTSGLLDEALKGMAEQAPVRVRVCGQSMAPLLPAGAEVEISPRRFYWPGEIVAFRAPDGRLLIHRLLGYRPHGWGLRLVTQGDAAPTPDPPVALSAVIGRVTPGPGTFGTVRMTQGIIAVIRFARLVLARLLRSLR